MSHYPSSAELAAFRRSIASPYSGPHGIRYSHGPLGLTDMRESGNYRGAWSHELQHGIGYRISDDLAMTDDDIEGEYAQARREASAMRSRAYARMLMDSWDPSGPVDWSYPYGIRPVTRDLAPRHPLPIVYHKPFSILA